jgi:hypothetical protein
MQPQGEMPRHRGRSGPLATLPALGRSKQLPGDRDQNKWGRFTWIYLILLYVLAIFTYIHAFSICFRYYQMGKMIIDR